MGTVERKIGDGVTTVTFMNPPKGFLAADIIAHRSVIIFTGGHRMKKFCPLRRGCLLTTMEIGSGNV